MEREILEFFRVERERLRDGWIEEEGQRLMDLQVVSHWLIGGRFWIHEYMFGNEEEEEEEAMRN